MPTKANATSAPKPEKPHSAPERQPVPGRPATSASVAAVEAAAAEAALQAALPPTEGATEETEAETPPETIAHISDATLPSRSQQAAEMERRMKASGKMRP